MLTGCASSTPPSRAPIPANLTSPCPALDGFNSSSWDDLMQSHLKLVIQYSECARKLKTFNDFANGISTN
ncbi:Rz1-like lysis system protein LysC [Zwartia sp.]|uniref:Rz1-like lysis system protein LysC n=1 Tax=Zwartia sp. TaxID=2978004 RepID=UPI003BAF2A24